MSDHNPCDDNELSVRLMQMLRVTWSVYCPVCRRSLGSFARNQRDEAIAAARDHIQAGCS